MASSLSFEPTKTTPGAGPKSRSPRKIPSAPLPYEDDSSVSKPHINKRIIVCCDGTWQDGILKTERQKYTNILRIARTIKSEDDRTNPPTPQIVFYQSGIGSEDNFYSEYVQGTTGATLADKVEEAYAFIAHNYHPGDDIYLFGFSRGAYTARMVAMFIGAIGVLNRTQMDKFADIFLAYQKRGKSKDPVEIQKLNTQLEPWTQRTSPGKLRADSDDNSFSVKCIGVFDTVGSLGLPGELTFAHSKEIQNIFGFPDKILGEHIERAYQALALNETRKDFDCARFEQTAAGRQKKQILRQCWFTGSHSDIGGGYDDHDLADLTLTWMAAHVGDILGLDLHYLASLPEPVAPWGAQKPHDPTTGVFSLATTIQRQLPTTTNTVTHETIHPSVLKQVQLYPTLKDDIDKHPQLVCTLKPLEEEMKANWPYKPGQHLAHDVATQAAAHSNNEILEEVTEVVTKLGHDVLSHITRKGTGIATESGKRVYDQNWLGDLADKAGVKSGKD